MNTFNFQFSTFNSMRKIFILLTVIFCVSCETNDNQTLGSLLITANVDACEFRIFDSSGRQIAKDIYDSQYMRFVSIPMERSGVFIIYAEYRDKSIKTPITYPGGIYEYCIEF